MKNKLTWSSGQGGILQYVIAFWPWFESHSVHFSSLSIFYNITFILFLVDFSFFPVNLIKIYFIPLFIINRGPILLWNKMVHSGIIKSCRAVIISRLSRNTLLSKKLDIANALYMSFSFYLLLNLRTVYQIYNVGLMQYTTCYIHIIIFYILHLKWVYFVYGGILIVYWFMNYFDTLRRGKEDFFRTSTCFSSLKIFARTRRLCCKFWYIFFISKKYNPKIHSSYV